MSLARSEVCQGYPGSQVSQVSWANLARPQVIYSQPGQMLASIEGQPWQEGQQGDRVNLVRRSEISCQGLARVSQDAGQLELGSARVEVNQDIGIQGQPGERVSKLEGQRLARVSQVTGQSGQQVQPGSRSARFTGDIWSARLEGQHGERVSLVRGSEIGLSQVSQSQGQPGQRLARIESKVRGSARLESQHCWRVSKVIESAMLEGQPGQRVSKVRGSARLEGQPGLARSQVSGYYDETLLIIELLRLMKCSEINYIYFIHLSIYSVIFACIDDASLLFSGGLIPDWSSHNYIFLLLAGPLQVVQNRNYKVNWQKIREKSTCLLCNLPMTLNPDNL